MKNILYILALVVIIIAVMAYINRTPKEDVVTPEEETENITTGETTQVVIMTNKGSITIELFKEDAPKTVENFVKLAQTGFYNGIKFHRVIKDFMIQTGDPLSKDMYKKPLWGTGGPGYFFEDEINRHKVVRGTLAMANSGPNTNGSQFFIVTAEATPHLDGKHTVFGKVTEGMDTVDIIEAVATEKPSNRPIEHIIIQSITIK